MPFATSSFVLLTRSVGAEDSENDCDIKRPHGLTVPNARCQSVGCWAEGRAISQRSSELIESRSKFPARMRISEVKVLRNCLLVLRKKGLESRYVSALWVLLKGKSRWV